MPSHQRKLLKNHFVLGFVPFGGDFNEFIKPFISEIKELEKGKVMNIQGQDVWVIASIGVVTADLPQGNDLAGVLRQNANKGCRSCTISKDSFTDFTQYIALTSRYHHLTDSEFALISAETVISQKKQLSRKYGLKLQPNILDELKRERYLQTPQDIYHVTAGKIGRLLKLTCELFSQEGENDFIKTCKDFEKPKTWSRIPNPISHRESFMMSDYLRLAIIMPFILNRFLKITSLKNNEAKNIQQRTGASRINLVKNIIITCWVHIAKTMSMVFKSKFTINSYEELQQSLKEEMNILPKVFSEFVNLPNLHVSVHLLMHAKTYGTLINTQCGIKEMVHRVFKAMVPRTNRKNIELDLLKRYTTLFAIRHLVDGGIDYRLSQSCNGFASLTSNFRHILTNWYITENKETSNEHDEQDNVTSPVNFITHITLKKGVSQQDRENIMLNLPHFNSELLLSFEDIGFKSALIYSQMSWYKLATYIIEETTSGVFSKIHLHIGDFVTIQEENHDECYAIIKGIFKYKANNNKFYAFIIIDWFEEIKRVHHVLKCPLYRIQATYDTCWRRIFPILVIDRVQKVHFVYDATNECWIKNDFFFTAI
ncbi:hypothetical protein GLOIN_2v1487024 [Rhizophagus irregularis DAOM 181602=DAOM 197198]|uniref:Uncharacterized protein n=1 Tax=Rhizophagus irregularis (strain DAOM 181602 / DAOM 197198 / MUCL 43194) TaxID=747089 RepID=A0A2P4P4Z2_RHIID|nr:hypothetical protein GLOIN_2v1487024 [Rhizophagus irregularis DAOM 181602=DAOM 197198]POG60455.1 hypothetical protein GLOIN_2v1487024 [Rhizophagus irregularis DAOM 181602=DAOM 197198]|eukprot:XP_025167321.1 hypothetical protein GLOIN_2v1487024 [Rhizophagus irregularis DAOM 181602=DAOM 197198]